jgi:hypothetical protein
VTSEPSHKNVDCRYDGNLSGLQSCDAVSLGKWFPKCRRNVVPSSLRITGADVRTKLMFLVHTPSDSVNGTVTSDKTTIVPPYALIQYLLFQLSRVYRGSGKMENYRNKGS